MVCISSVSGVTLRQNRVARGGSLGLNFLYIIFIVLQEVRRDGSLHHFPVVNTLAILLSADCPLSGAVLFVAILVFLGAAFEVGDRLLVFLSVFVEPDRDEMLWLAACSRSTASVERLLFVLPPLDSLERRGPKGAEDHAAAPAPRNLAARASRRPPQRINAVSLASGARDLDRASWRAWRGLRPGLDLTTMAALFPFAGELDVFCGGSRSTFASNDMPDPAQMQEGNLWYERSRGLLHVFVGGWWATPWPWMGF